MNARIACLLLSCGFFLLTPPRETWPASLQKAELYKQKGDSRGARKQYAAVIRKGSRAERETAYLGLAESYFYEKDFSGVLRSLEPLESRFPDSKKGAWMRVLLYRSARAAGESDAATRHYQAIFGGHHDFSFAEISEHLRQIKKMDIIKETPKVPADPNPDPSRQHGFLLAESLTGMDIVSGASRIWMALAASRLDNIGRVSLLRLGQSLDWEGKWPEVIRYLKLYAFLFPEDPGAADALYRFAKWSAVSGDGSFAEIFDFIAEFYPETLYGVTAIVDMAWTWPDQTRIRRVYRAVRESSGLPSPVLERGLAAVLEHLNWLENPSDASWVAGRYIRSFPQGPVAAKARAYVEANK